MDKTMFHPDRFEIFIDARGFRPDEIKCTVTKHTIEIVAQKEDQCENAQKRTSLIRQYFLPKNTVPENAQCCLTSEGTLLVTAPWAK
ncbi:hypothetical protein ABEB36_012042 [Hypothenemus hampei]|uniref:SHSP domain-containing protein n=1 Tax=Hypothenemus hampei TaxID=57062 RepID=A0ABD1E9Z0_HYPHA